MSNLSLFSYFAAAGPVVKAVMLILLLCSVASWTMIFQRWWFLNKVQAMMKKFEENFWAGAALPRLFSDIDNNPEKKLGLAHIFHAGFKEFMRLRQQAVMQPSAIMEGAQRAMYVAYTRETEKLEKHLAFLASVGSTSPYIGLFGTVWGIMTSFHALGQVQQATIAMVAPGISEALIATAMGLFAAIPAVLAYNRFSSQVTDFQQRYGMFQEEFSNVLHRQIYNQQPSKQ